MGGGSEFSLAQQGSPQGRYGEALKHWETTLPRLVGNGRFDTLLSMAAAYQALGQVEAVLRFGPRSHATDQRYPHPPGQRYRSRGDPTPPSRPSASLLDMACNFVVTVCSKI